jgi:dienelactone hydrolase
MSRGAKDGLSVGHANVLRGAPMLVAAMAVAVSCSSGGGAGTGAGSPTSTPGVVETDSPTGTSADGAAPATGPLAYTDAGPYPVGTVELDTPNGPVTVWYPGEPGQETGREKATYDMASFLPTADQAKVAGGVTHAMDAYPDLPAAQPSGQPFPLVLFSHGFCGFRQQSSYLTTAIASWGFVVAAPEHEASDLTACLAGTYGQGASTTVQDLRAAIPVLEAESLRDEGPLATIIDTGRVAVVGQSLGGSAAIEMSGDPNVVTFVALAAGGGSAPPAKPGLFIAGDADSVAPAAGIEQWWTTSVPAPKQLAVLGGVTHLGLTDVCTIAPEQGGLVPAVAGAGVAVADVVTKLYADGCDPSHTAATAAWPAIRHLTIAQLRVALGMDPAPVALDPSVADAYDGLTVRYQSA